MTSNWHAVRLGDVTDWASGGTPPKDDPKYWGGDIPWISALSMHGNRYYDSDLKLTEAGLARGSRLVEPGTVLLLVRGGALHQRMPVGIATRPVAFNQDVKAIRARDGLLPWFLLYWFLAKERELLGLVSFTGIGAGKFDTKQLQDVPILLPPTENEQNRIVSVAKALDDKIELNCRMNETMEAIARALFKSWFVDFDPVRAKMSGEPPESICQRLGLTPDLLALFPDRLVDSELGEIPEGWDVKPLDGIADYLNGLALQKFPPESETEWLPVIKIAQLKKGDSIGADRASHNLRPEYIVDDGDVLFSWSGSLEVDVWCGGRGALNQHLFKVTSINYAKWFYFYWTKHHLAHFQAIAAGKAVTMGHIQRKHLTQALCAVPRKSLMDGLDAIMVPLLEEQIENRKASRTLAMVRDALLPKLLSGELRVPVTGAA